MELKCPVCGSTEIITGHLQSSGGLVFVPFGETGFWKKKSSSIDANACKKCGEVFGFKLTDSPSKLTDR
ncbi:MAG: hypothetical protein IJO91_06915 [Oscillospiraceae bacterium]|nr:hypothetical protein [Oscillospiraceae bacterium]